MIFQIWLRSTLEALFRPPLPIGLVEHNLLFDVPSVTRPAEKSIVRDILIDFTHWMSTAAPSLSLTCKLFDEGDDQDWQWPDLRQSEPRAHTVLHHTDIHASHFPYGDGEDFESEDSERTDPDRWPLWPRFGHQRRASPYPASTMLLNDGTEDSEWYVPFCSRTARFPTPEPSEPSRIFPRSRRILRY